jgi:hypothetical protein
MVDDERAQLVSRLKGGVTDAATRAVAVLDSLAVGARSESVQVAAAGKLLDLAVTRRHRVDGVSVRDLMEVVTRVYEIADRLLPVDRRPRFAREVDAMLEKAV